MSETTNQMSLLDAIGFSAPEATGKQKKDKPAKAEKSEKKQRKKAAAKPEAEAASGAESNDTREAEIDVAVAETPVSQEIADTGETPDVSAETQAGEDPGTEQAASAAHALASDQDDDSQKIHDGSLPLDRHLCFALYSANHAMHGVYKALLKEVGLTYPQFLAMTVLWETNNVPVGTITSKLQLDTNTLTPLLKRLEAMGLVTRTRNIKDERQVILKLTRKGRALQKKTEHFSTCIMSSTGLKLEEVIDLQAKVMTLRDNLRKAGLE
ncbi:MarR family transcriptional regulator [Roseibium aggregatum]|uniref:MarR family winged helix-turn-helix transcriptional regulator n=1 Tax=Roseibium aggregatum TaxID=187304 RepID=UPI001E2FF240|nr:MarR family transcriptional regulator [Roseibium aggregatum]UES58095.1 MarR family transcriptional regulator [Roseibium aggregatum]